MNPDLIVLGALAVLCDVGLFYYLYRQKKRRAMQRSFERIAISGHCMGIALQEIADAFGRMAQ